MKVDAFAENAFTDAFRERREAPRSEEIQQTDSVLIRCRDILMKMQGGQNGLNAMSVLNWFS